MNTFTTLCIKRISAFVCTLTIATCLLTANANAQLVPVLQQQPLNINNILTQSTGTSLNQLPPTQAQCDCSAFSVCITLQVNDNCYGAINGSATASASGGTTPYNYSWNTNPVQTGATAHNLSAGTYTVTVTDGMGCSATACVTITQGNPIIIAVTGGTTNSCSGYYTVTQGGWGTKCSGGNPGCYRDAHFSSCFPNGLTIGCTNTLTLSSSSDVQNFLPSGGTPSTLPSGALTNPGSSYSNTFAGQLVAATLNVGFDNCDPNFAPATGSLGNLIVASGEFAGLTVNQVLTIANQVIGGCSSAYSPSDLTNVLDGINSSYDSGNVTGFLVCPSAICQGTCETLTASGSSCVSYKWSPSTGLSSTVGSSVQACPTVTTTYTVTGTNSSGCSGTTQIVVTVTTGTTITVNTPAPICQGSCATLTVSGAPCTSYTWSPSTGLSATTGSSVQACPTVTTTYTVTGPNNNGCTSTGKVVVTVNTGTTITVNTPAPICQGNCATLTVSGAPCISYTWSPSTGLSATTGSSVQACPTVTTTYTVTGPNNNGCTSTGKVVVTVNTGTTITVNTPAPICQGNCATLTVSGAPCTSYTWSPSTGLSATTGSSVQACPTVTTTYTVTGPNNNGCTSTGKVVVTVNPLPTISVPGATVCYGGCASLTASGAVTYTWSPAAGLSATTGAIVNACPTATTTYTITGTNGNYCVGTTKAVVTVNPSPGISVPGAVVCYGSCASLTASGSSTYTWSPAAGLSATTGAIVNACPTTTTTYTITGTSSTNCIATTTAVVTVNPLPTVTATAKLSAVCSGSPDTLYASGTATHYTWSPSAGLNVTVGTMVIASPTVNTTYTVTGSNTNTNCIGTDTVSVKINPSPQPKINSEASTICAGTPDVLTASGATSYIWSPATGLSATTGSSVIANPTESTTYSVIGISNIGCASLNVTLDTITVNPLPTIAVPPASICIGSCAQLTASGAVTYTWSPSTGLSATTGSSVNACPTLTTTYTIIGTNANGCIDTTTTVVNVNPLPVISVPPASVCIGNCASLTASGATSYTWSPATALSATTGSIVNACPRATTTYTVTGTNGNNCVGTTTVVVTVNPLPVVTLTAKTPSICIGGSDTITASGATTYTWSPSTGLNKTTGAVVIATPTATTTYKVIGVNANGCVCSDSITIIVNTPPTISVPPATVCIGSCAALTASGAVSYTWSPAAGLSATTGAIVNACPTAATTYTIIGTNQNGCVGTTTTVVNVNPLPEISVPGATVCIGNCASLTASGAVSYTWSPAAGLSATTGAIVNACPTATTTYTITGTNANNCSATTTTVVNVNPLPVISVPGATVCIGNCASLTASGAVSYTWSPAAGLSATTGAIVNACPTAATTYTIIGTNANNCTSYTTTVVNVNPLPQISVPGATVCIGSCASLTASGAVSYTWSPATGLSATTGAIVNACPTATTTYTIIGTNANNCTSYTTAVVNVNPLPQISVPGATVCNGSCASLTASGAVSYTWSPATGLSATTGAIVSACPTATTTYTITGTNANNCTSTTTTVVNVNALPVISVPGATVCNGSCASLTASGAVSYTWSPATGLSATTGAIVSACPTATTTYTVIGTNENNCSNSTTTVVNVNPLPVISVPGATVCTGSCAALTASGAASYTWSPAAGLSATTGSIVNACPTATTTYIIIGTNSNNCTSYTTAVVNVNPLPQISVPGATVCNGNCASLTASGAVSYTWSPAAGLSATTGAIVSACPTATTTYTITGTNANNCSSTTTTVVDVNALPVISVPGATVCIGNCTSLTASGAVSYAWSPAAGLSATTGAIVSACPTATTTYTITGTSGTNCTSTTTAVVNVNPLPQISVPGATVCIGNCASLTASGAVSYTWSPAAGLSATTGAIVNACPTATTTYTIIGTNSNNCTSYTTTVVNVNPLPQISVPGATVCNGNCASLTASGAVSYTWSPATGLSATTGAIVSACPTATTTYTIIGTNENNCSNYTTTVVNVNALPVISVPGATVCVGSCASLTASGAVSYTWSPAAGLSATTGAIVNACPTATTTYTIIGTSGTNCTSSTTAVVNVNPLPQISVPGATVCIGNCASLTASGAVSYTWSPAAGLSATTGAIVSACPTATTTYTIIGTNANNCTSYTTTVVNVNPLPVISVPGATVCIGSCAPLTASGAKYYTWSPASGLSATNGSIVNACPTITTTYTVTGINENYCSATTTVVVTVNPLTTLTLKLKNDTVCVGANVTFTVGATGNNLTYTWKYNGVTLSGRSSDTLNIPSVTLADSGVYSVIVSGTCGNDTSSATLKVNSKPVITKQPRTNIMCAVNGQCGGHQFCVTATGVNLSYQWYFRGNPILGATSACYAFDPGTFADTGKYFVIVSNQCGADTSDTAIFILINSPIVNVPSASICYGNCATLTASGAVSYTWSPATALSATTGSIVNACPTITTTYTVIGTGAAGCTDTTTTVVTVNPPPTISVPPATICYGNCTTLQASGLGENGTYTWSASEGENTSTGASIQVCPITTTTYTIIGTNGSGCSDTITTVVTVNPLPIIYVPGATICTGSCAPLTASGAVSYTWSPSTGLSATTGSLVNACPTVTTTYTVTGTNANDCVGTTTVVVNVNSLPIISVPPASVCIGNCASLTASGATSYTWSPATALSATTGSIVNACPEATTTYTVTGTNGNNCVGTTTVVVTVNPLPVITITATSPSVCIGGSDTLTASGATTYTWSPAAGLNTTTGAVVIATPTATTTYKVIGVNANGCVCSDSITIIVNQPPTISVPPATVCIGSCAPLTASGAVSYTWSPAAGLSATTGAIVNACPTATTTYTIVGTNQNGCVGTTTTVVTVNPLPTITVQPATICKGTCTTLEASGLGDGGSYIWAPSAALSETTGGASVQVCPTATTTYTIVGTNRYGCSNTTTVVVTVSPLPIITVPPISICYGQSGELTASGATYYTWKPGTGLSATTGSIVTANPTTTTTYTVVGTGGADCVDSTTVVVTVTPLPNINITQSDSPICVGATDTLRASGATSYTWSPAVNTQEGLPYVTVSPTVTTTYTVIGTNDNGCADTTTVIVTVIPLPTVTVTATAPKVCQGSPDTLIASGATSYTWSPATGLNKTTGDTVIASPSSTTTYTVTGTNANGCIGTANDTVIVNPAPRPQINAESSTICAGTPDTLTASGATSYIWSPSTGLSATTGSQVVANPTVSSTYAVVGISDVGCASLDITLDSITVNPLPTITIPPVAICNGQSTELTASGAVSYTWSPTTGLSSSTDSIVTANPTLTTTYTVIGINGGGCADTTTVVVTVNPLPTVSVPPAIICNGSSAILTASGATSYIWKPETGLNETIGNVVTASPTITTTYTVIGTNGFDCIDSTTVVVTVNPLPQISVPPAAICYGTCTTLQASGLGEGGNYTWAPSTALSQTTGGLSVQVCPTATTTYTVIGTNGSGCADTTTVVVTVNPLPNVSVPPAAICYGQSTILTASGATSYTWKPGTGLDETVGDVVTANPTTTTTYTVIGTNGFDCVDSTTVVVTVDSLPSISVPPAAICYGGSTILSVTGAPSSTQIVLPDSASHNDLLDSNHPTTNFEGFYEFDAWHWTVSGNTTIGRSIIKYNLSGIPAGSTITSASLSLYGDSASHEDNGGSYSSATNASYLQLLTSSWNPSTVTWNNQPDTTTTDEVALSKSTSEWENYPNINVTALISDLYNNPSTYTGIMLRLQNENPVYDGLIFGSSTNTNTRIHPKLVITYTSGASNNSSNSYTWAPSTGLSATTGSSVIANPTATTTYTVVATNGNGCTDTTTVVVTVNPVPTIIVQPAAICYGTCTTLQASGLGEGGNYVWAPSTALSQTTGGLSVQVCPTATTTYTVMGTNGSGCSDTTTVVVTVNPLPTVSVPPAAICYGQSTILTASGATSYTWKPETGLNETVGNVVTANPTTTTTYTVIGTNGFDCVDSTTVVVTVNPLPTVSVPPAAICYGQSAILTASGATSYTWKPETGLNETIGNVVTASPTITTTYTVIGTNGFDCLDSTTVVVTVNPLPSVSVTQSDSPICVGTIDTLRATGATSYTWSPAVHTQEGLPYVTVNPTVTTTYTVIGTNGSGCSDTTTVIVTVNPLPTVSVPPASICYGSSTALTASGADSYTWSPSGSLTASTGAIVTASPTTTTTYTVIGTNTSGCADTTTTVVTVNPLPTATTSHINVLCYGTNTGEAIVTASGGTGSYKYAWSTEPVQTSDTAKNLGAGTYSVTVTDADGCSVTVNDTITQPYPLHVTVNLTDTTICSGSAVTLIAHVTGGTTKYSYSWSPGNQTTDTITVNPTVATTYTVVVVDANGCMGTKSAHVSILPGTNITTQLKNDTVCAGSSATFCVTATGSNLSYQWQFKGNNIIGAANSPCYTVTSASSYNAGVYDVIVTGACGADTSYATLKVNTKPVITIQPVCLTVCLGSSATFCVTATGTNLTYQWQFNGKNIYGANSACYTIESVTNYNAGCYTVIVTNTCGSVCSNIATLTITTPPIITCQPKSESLCSTNGKCGGNGVTFCVTATGTNLTYQWQYNGNNIPYANSSCYTINRVYTSNAGNYRVIVSNSCGSDTSSCAVLTIGSSPCITSQPVCVSVCSGSSATFCVTATGTNLTYQWQFNGKNINGANSSCYTIQSAAACNAGCYDVVVSNSCGSVTSNVATLTINTPPVITCQPKSESLCSTNGKCGGNGITFCVTATGTNLTYQWQYNGSNIHNATSSCYTINPVYTSNAGNYRVIVSNSCGSDTSSCAVLTIGSSPCITSQPVCVSVCSGSSATFCVTATGTNLTYQWQFNGKNISGATSCCYTIASTAACNAGCYDVVVSNSCGSITSSTATLTIGAPPAITCQPQSQSLCSVNGKCGGSGVTFCVTATGSNLSYQWQYNGKNINGANSSCYTINPVTTSNAGCYDVVVSNSCTSVTSNIATLTIGSAPCISSQPVCLTVCSGNSATFCVTATGSNLTYQWQFNGKNISGATSCCYTISSAATCNAGCYDVVVSNSCGSITSSNATLTVNAAPCITSQPVCETVCAGSTTTFSVTANGTNLSYQWQFNGKNISGATSSCYTISTATSSNAGCYDVVVSNCCGSITSNTVTLTVNNCSTCATPTSLCSSDITCSTAKLSWSYTSSASSFTVEYRVHGCSTWTTVDVTTCSFTLCGLNSGTNYDWSVRENCSCGSSSSYASVVSFCTSSSCGCNNMDVASTKINNNALPGGGAAIDNLKVYPNPTFSTTTVEGTFETASNITIMVTDLSGRVIMSENENAPAGDYIHQFDMSNQPQGTYFLVIKNGDQMVTSKIVKIQ